MLGQSERASGNSLLRALSYRDLCCVRNEKAEQRRWRSEERERSAKSHRRRRRRRRLCFRA